MTMTTDTTALADEAGQDEKYAQYGRTAGPARMAVLTYLARNPGGASFEQLAAVVRIAVGHYVPDRRVLHVLQNMRNDHRVEREIVKVGPNGARGQRWYSPGSRQAAMARGLWTRDHETPAPAARTSVATARGLAA